MAFVNFVVDELLSKLGNEDVEVVVKVAGAAMVDKVSSGNNRGICIRIQETSILWMDGTAPHDPHIWHRSGKAYHGCCSGTACTFSSALRCLRVG